MQSTQSEAAWQELRLAAKNSQRGEGWVRRHALDIPNTRLWYAVRIESELPALMLDIAESACASLKTLPATGGIAVTVERFADLPVGIRAVTIVLRQPEFTDLFGVFGDDLLTRLGRCTSAADAVTTLLARIERWQRFLTAGLEGLGESAVVGLMGELIVLRDLVLPTVGPSGVMYWTGPDRELKDFQFADETAIEVKSTASAVLSHVRVNHESQLTPGRSSLYLVCMRLARGAGMTLNDLVHEVRFSLSHSSEQATVFERQLYEAGYWVRHAERYEGSRFEMVEQRIFRAKDGFPSISASSLAAGIDSVSYRLALVACVRFEISIESFTTELRKEIGL